MIGPTFFKSVGTPGEGYYSFWCPGCKRPHTINKNWMFAGTDAKPTLTESVLTYAHACSPPFKDQPRCHLHIRDGEIQYLADCDHELAGKTVPMLPYP